MITEQSVQYYAKSVAIHVQVYQRPERQEDLEEMRARVAEAVEGHVVLELACGGGYWTEVLAESAESVVATDINPAM
ncbi:MAG: SAM-dependent methyltransferase, partial [Massilia sp.]|nr:SAM-dependent methyltransferase [Massilia sp.]